MKKTSMTIIAGLMLFALPVVANAHPVFPNITGDRVGTPPNRITFLTMSGFVGNLNVSFTTFTGISPKATTKVRNFNKARGDRGVEENNESILIPDNSGRFVEFADLIVFGDDAELSLFGPRRNGVVAPLLTPRGNKAFGPVNFELLLSPDISALLMPNLGIGEQIRVRGAAEVTLIVTNPGHPDRIPPVPPKGVLLVTNFQPRDIRKRTVLGNESSIPANARVSMSAAVKTFSLHTSINLPPLP